MNLSRSASAQKKSNGAIDAAEHQIEQGIEKLRADLAELVSSLQKAGAEKGDHYRENLGELADGIADVSRKLAGSSRNKAEELESSLIKAISERPFQALALAAGAGALLALLTSRGNR